MSTFSYQIDPDEPTALGLLVLQADERLERDFRVLLPEGAALFVSRVPSYPEVTPETLQSMAAHLTGSAQMLPEAAQYAAVGYGCTSGTAQIGPGQIEALVKAGVTTPAVTEPVSALIAACQHLDARRLTFLSPYVASVSDRLRAVLAENGIDTPVFGSFDEGEEAKVARITPNSIVEAAVALAEQAVTDALFLSCTNLRGVEAGPEIARQIGRPVLSSNLVLAWHMCQLAGLPPPKLDHSAS